MGRVVCRVRHMGEGKAKAGQGEDERLTDAY